jgi:hypothetical protein
MHSGERLKRCRQRLGNITNAATGQVNKEEFYGAQAITALRLSRCWRSRESKMLDDIYRCACAAQFKLSNIDIFVASWVGPPSPLPGKGVVTFKQIK